MSSPFQESLADQIARAARLAQWDELAQLLSSPLAEAASDGVVTALTSLGVDDAETFRLASDDAVADARDRAAELVGKQRLDDLLVDSLHADAITETTRAGLRDLVARGLEDGWSADELAQEVEDSYLFSPARAEAIARTELAQAHTQGNLAAWQRAHVPLKRWLLGSDHDLDDVCDENAAVGPIPVGSAFPSGDDGPPAHPNCVCAVVAVYPDQAGPAVAEESGG